MNRDRPRPRWPDEQLVEALAPTPLPVASPEPAPLPTLPAPAARTGEGCCSTWAAPTPPAGSPLALLRALGWTPGLTLHADVVTGAILITPAADGAHFVGTREELPLPAAVRHLCGIAPGEPVLLAALPRRNRIVVHPSNTITARCARRRGSS
ncbi:hypothetical protein NIE79_004747 [Micromonospora sp. NIE79]|uniref:AbrB/MazE/SpoVT family DNA-binding domain-containing protein n=1 Tax=Micromonospora trifolii TaxID=2911208 RepID=A0ABS9N894_9ACTN|nr:hypothetical protein [Micromonospora trifolii]MCG5446179.1 hypothetical protein [Micromonospora trifolii]